MFLYISAQYSINMIEMLESILKSIFNQHHDDEVESRTEKHKNND